MDNHYSQLGVERSASADQIKAAYRKMARRYHPDVSKESDAAEKIKSINEAYAVLGDPARRKSYDRMLDRGHHASFENDAFQGSHFHGDVHDLFEQLFRKASKPINTLTITLEQAFSGGKVLVNMSGEDIEIDIPKGILEGEAVKSGDLEFKIRFAHHPKFQWQGGHIISAVPIAPWMIALGGKVNVQTLAGMLEVNLPPGLQPGQRVRLPGKGLPGNRARGAFDHWCMIEWSLPMPTNDAQKAAYQKLAESFSKK